MKEIIHSSDAPEAIGPYSQAVKQNGMVYCSGQIPVDPRSGEMAGDEIESQTRQVMENLGKVLQAAGSGFQGIVKCTIFLADMKDFARMNEVYGSYFQNDPPARETVAVRGLPRDSRVEISCIAVED